MRLLPWLPLAISSLQSQNAVDLSTLTASSACGCAHQAACVWMHALPWLASGGFVICFTLCSQQNEAAIQPSKVGNGSTRNLDCCDW